MAVILSKIDLKDLCSEVNFKMSKISNTVSWKKTFQNIPKLLFRETPCIC